MEYYVGIDIGGSSIKYGLTNNKGEIIQKDNVKTATNGQEIISTLLEIVTNYEKQKNISAIGISIPGVVEENGFLTTAGAIYDFYGLDLKNILEEELSLPVFIENDAISSALAEKWLGAGKDYSNILTAVVGTGVGGAIIIDNKVVRGAHSSAGELGFMIVEEIVKNDTRQATLSLQGAVHSGLVQNYINRATEKNSIDKLNGEVIFNLAKENDVIALKVIDEFYQKLAIGLFNTAVFLDPEIILIGGGISSNDEFIIELNERVNKLKDNHSDMSNVTLPKIVACYFLNDAGIIGATYKAIQGNKNLLLQKNR